jgi:hypothetical protein
MTTALQDASRDLILLIGRHKTYHPVASAINAVYEAARDNTEDDESLVSIATTLADTVVKYHTLGTSLEDVHLAVRFYIAAEMALIQDLGSDSPSPAT